MMKVQLEFSLPEEQKEYTSAINGHKYKKAIELMEDFIEDRLQETEHSDMESYAVYVAMKSKLKNFVNNML